MEATEIKRIGAQPIKNSGRNHYKGDAVWKIFVVDVKERGSSMVISRAVWGKIVSDTLKHGLEKFPALCLVLGQEPKVRLAVIEWSLFEELVEAYVRADK